MRTNWRVYLLAMVVLLMTLPIWAKPKADRTDTAQWSTTQAVMVGTMQVEAGTYTLRAEESGKTVKVLHNGKVVAQAPCHGAFTHGRASQVSRRSFDARRPLPPRVAHPLHVLVTSRPVSGFIILGSLTTTDARHEAETGSLALWLTSSLSRSSTARLPTPPPSLLHGERAIAMVSTFQLTRSGRLSLADPRTRRGEAMKEIKNAWRRTAWRQDATGPWGTGRHSILL